MDLATELKKIVVSLRETLALFDAIPTPELDRPNIAHGQPPTKELIEWTVRLYVYCALCQFREILRSIVLLHEAGQVSATFLCCRGAFELAAHAYYVKKHAMQYLKAGNLGLAWQFMLEINAGSRHTAERQRKGNLGGPAVAEGPHVAKIINCFNEYFREHQKEEPANETYSFLSEFSHPNSYAFTNHFDWEEPTKEKTRVKFGRPSWELFSLCLPDALLACMALLSSTDDLLKNIGDASLRGVLEKFIAIREKELEAR